MDKSYLQEVIEKYYLNSIIERAILKVTDKKINISFINPNKNLVGNITADFDLEDCEMGIYDTSQLLKLINITDDKVSIRVNKSKSVTKTLYIEDNNYNLEYSLANVMLIPDVPKVEEPDYDMVANLDSEFITKFVKAAKAVNIREDKTPLTVTMTASSDFDGSKTIEFTIGETNSDYTNKIHLTLVAEQTNIIGARVKFLAEEFRSILEANKDMEKGKLNISEEGLLKVEFENKEKIKSNYLLVAQS